MYVKLTTRPPLLLDIALCFPSLRGATRQSNPEEAKHNIDKLGYYEIYTDITDAIQREKQIKGGSRKAKLKLI